MQTSLTALFLALALGQCPVVPPPENTMARAGCPQAVRPCARPSDTGRYVGYYVGGGTPWRGDGRAVNEGTWGWDYRRCLLGGVMLRWSHGCRYQGGTGAYATDREKILCTK
jgi:hypothetical protein